jgi:hypothetical protein
MIRERLYYLIRREPQRRRAAVTGISNYAMLIYKLATGRIA